MSADATTLWARAFVDELARCGVVEVVVAPGSRSTPLVLALADHGAFRLRVHPDERSAGFFALGVGKATGGPAAVVTTSGTATANLLPAVVEAAQAETPLLVLTADRPPRLRGADANQAIDQVGLYGGYVRAFFETAAPEVDGPALRHLRVLACRAVAAAAGPPAGPVHVNLPFDKPLEPVDRSASVAAFEQAHPLAATGRPDGSPFVRVAGAARRCDEGQIRRLADLVAAARRPVVVAGPTPRPERLGPAVVAFARGVGAPLLADSLSGARHAPGADGVGVAGYDLFLRDTSVGDALAPDLVVRVGASPTSAPLMRWLLDRNGVRHVVLDGDVRWKDHAAVATDYLTGDAAGTLEALTPSTGGAGEAATPSVTLAADPAWTARWRTVDRAARAALAEDATAGDPGLHEARVLPAVVAAMPDGATLFVSSSMPVRDLDAFAPPSGRPLTVRGNRGASGIDGIVSTAFGVARGPTVCVLGDLAFFHDQNGLLFAREADRPVVFVLVDNDGGGIFHALPVAAHEPHFTTFFATPHGLDLAHAAALHGLPFGDTDVPGVGAAVAAALAAGGTRVVRVRTGRAGGQERRRVAADAVAAAVRAALDRSPTGPETQRP